MSEASQEPASTMTVLDRRKSGGGSDEAILLQRSTTILEMTRWQQEASLLKLQEVTEVSSFEDSSEDEADTTKQQQQEPCQVHSYMAGREMTKLQERWNALTMIPSPLYCLYYILAGKWILNATTTDVDWSEQQQQDDACLHVPFLSNLYTIPPLPVIFVACGIWVHAPFSFVYHWKYAHALPPGFSRTDHLSRRLDQAMIHAASMFISFATSGSWHYFLANVIYNADCMRRHFQKEVHPRRNQVRIAFSMLFYTLPIRDFPLFCSCWSVILVAVWLFVRYPFGGWSHSAFHLVMVLLPPLIMEAACQLESSQHVIAVASKCAAGKL